MGRNSRTKKERRDAKRRQNAPKKPAVQGAALSIVGWGPGADEHGLYDDCPICTAMREMGLASGDVATPAQALELQEAFAEAHQQGAPGFLASDAPGFGSGETTN